MWPPRLSSLVPLGPRRTPRRPALGVAVLLYLAMAAWTPGRAPAASEPRHVRLEMRVVGLPAPGYSAGEPSVLSGPALVTGPGAERVDRVQALLRLTGTERRSLVAPVFAAVALDGQGRPCPRVEVQPMPIRIFLPLHESR